MSRGRAALLAASLVLAAAAAAEPRYLHNRWDYEAFRAVYPEVLEPNYLPFMAARVALPAASPAWRRPWRWLAGWLGAAPPPPELLVFCRWSDGDFPLAVHVVPPVIDPGLGDALFPRPPGEYVAAVERALGLWEDGLEGRVGFEMAASRAEADLTIELRGEEAPTPDASVQVLGATPLGDACQVERLEGTPLDPRQVRRLAVRYRVPELRVFVADRHGLLLPDQVEKVALHEIGHALGMHGHSPIPNDLMFRVVRDRLPRGELGAEDVNSFVSLYSIPNGTVYRDLPEAPEAPPDLARELPTPPRLALAPHVDPRLGFEVQLPAGWTHLAMEQGVVAVEGVTWDYTCSIQILVRGYPSLADYLGRYAGAHLGGGTLVSESDVEVAGRPALRFVLAAPEAGAIEELTFLESGDGRVVIAIGECPEPLHASSRVYFDAVLDSLELHGVGPAARGREYAPGPEEPAP